MTENKPEYQAGAQGAGAVAAMEAVVNAALEWYRTEHEETTLEEDRAAVIALRNATREYRHKYKLAEVAALRLELEAQRGEQHNER